MEKKKCESKLPSGCTKVWVNGSDLQLKEEMSLKRTKKKAFSRS